VRTNISMPPLVMSCPPQPLMHEPNRQAIAAATKAADHTIVPSPRLIAQ
jgi:hypothetical protein